MLREIDALAEEPGWIEHQREASRHAGFHLLLYDSYVSLDDGNTEQLLVREVLSLHDEQGLDLAGDLTVSYVPTEEALMLVHLRRRGADGEPWEPLEYQVQLDRAGKVQGMYVDERTVAFIPAGLRPGDQVDFAYMLVGRRNPDTWDWYENDNYGSHVCSRRIRFETPDDLSLKHAAKGFGPPTVVRERGRTAIAWNVSHADPPLVEEWLPDDFEPFRTLTVSSAASWEDLGGRYAELLERIPVSDEVRELGARLSGQGGDPVARLAAWVQTNIRYVGIEISAHRLVPVPPSQTLERGYGDCKDMSLLLTHLLRSAGIDAWPAMVRSPERGPLDPAVPLLAVFDHEIVAVECDGRLVFVDPTIKDAVPPWSGAIRKGARALVVDAEHGLVEAGEQPDELDSVRVEIDAREQPCEKGQSGSCMVLDSVTRYAGPALSSMRQRLRAGLPEELRREAANYFKRATAGRSLLDMTHDYSGANRAVTPLTIRERFVFGPGDTRDQCLLRYLPPEIEEWFNHPTVAGRSSPLGLAHPRETEVALTLHTPRAREFALPVQWRHEDGFVRLTRRSSRLDDGVRTEWRAATLKGRVPLDELPRYASRMDREVANAEIALCPTGETGPVSEDSDWAWLRPRLFWAAGGLLLGLLIGLLLRRRRLGR